MDITNLLSNWTVQVDGAVPMYIQLANVFTAKIQNMTLQPGDKLPPERELAKALNVSRTTAINAYKLLEERGLVLTKIGSGTYVAAVTKQMAETTPVPWEQLFTPQYRTPTSSIIRNLVAMPAGGNHISFATGMPDPAFYPLHILQEGLVSSVDSVDRSDFGYMPTEGYPSLRKALALWQKSYGIESEDEGILIISGSQQGLYLIVKALIEPRDFVVVESPTYLGAIQILESAGARILCLPPGDSLRLDVLEDYLIRYRPKFFYTIPTFQNPTGRVMSLQERRALLALAEKHHLVLVEDDPYGHLYYEQKPPLSLKALDTYGGVIYLSTFSKSLFPGLRIGWLTAPAAVVNRLAQEKQYVDLQSNNLSQKVLTSYLDTGDFEAHLQKMRAIYKLRRDAMAQALQRYCAGFLDFPIPEGGFYLWCTLAPRISGREFWQRAARAGVSFVPGEAFYAGIGESQQFRLCFVSHEEEILREGVRRLGRILASGDVWTEPATSSGSRPLI
ncbi:MAG: PLP-dependent aminotransferase family protein [Sporomusaceae bacterium]|nr:PLP-dependent aminotransferase family protein [Sporomusaceae bacterium]